METGPGHTPPVSLDTRRLCYSLVMRYHGAVIRPPSEASSLIVQVTYGCSNDTCDFCGTYLGKPFAVRPFSEVQADIVNLPLSVKQQVERVFLADGDALVLSSRRLLELLALLRYELPRLQRVSSYATALNLLAKTDAELRDVRAAGLTLIYLGLESGDDETLMAVHKGITVQQQIEGCRRAAQAGIDLSITAILGLAGAERSLLHAQATGAALSAIDPQYIGLLTLMLTPGTAMAERVRRGELVLPNTLGMVRELREIVAHTNVSDCLFRSNHASNYLPVGGHLPHDKDEMLRALDMVLAAPEKATLRPESWRQL